MRVFHLTRPTVLLLILIIAGSYVCFSQQADSLRFGSIHRVIFPVNRSDSVLQLPHQFVVEGSDSIWIDSLRLESGRHYILDARRGMVMIRYNMFPQQVFDTSRLHRLIVRYQSYPFIFQRKYQHREPVTTKDTSTGEIKKVSKPTHPFSADELFGGNLQKSGSIVRGLSIGTNRDLSLNSGFRLQMQGSLSNNIDIVAALTDENTPIQPEGTTQMLQEIDKVFVEVKGTDVSATLGDFNLSMTGNEFARLNRKVQGAKGVANYRGGFANGEVTLAGAVARGKFTINEFQGIDGVQGPYRLVGRNNERDIVVIAGTERVYVNGEHMTRGEANDYVVDYGIAEITFASKRLISQASRITVDFEYTDRQFNRNLIAVTSGSKFLNDKLSFNLSLYREADDKDSPIDISLSDQDKDTLRGAGSDRLKAVRSGVEYVGPGKGQYKDTVISLSGDSTMLRIYQYAPEDTLNAVYAIVFTFVGVGSGDYEKIAVGRYQFVGVRKGSYLPIRFLPMPQSHSLGDANLQFRASNDLTISAEYALSKFDANQFSDKDDVDNVGGALQFGVQFSPKEMRIGKSRLGSLDMNLKERYVDRRFVPIDRLNDIEFNRKWNIVSSTQTDEEIREGSISYQPIRSLNVTGGIGKIRRGDLFSSNRYTASGQFLDSLLPKVKYELEAITSSSLEQTLNSNWTRQRGTAEYTFSKLTPSLRYEREVRSDKNSINDTLNVGSFRFNEIAPRIEVKRLGKMTLSSELTWRWDDSLLTRTYQRASLSFTQSYGWQLQEWNSLSSTLDVSLRKRTFTGNFRARNNVDVQTILVRSQTRFNPLNRGIESDWFYEVASERSAKLERLFQRVPKGTGNYVYLGDVNGNRIVDEQDFQLSRFDGEFISILIPSDQFVPVTDLKVSSRFRFNGSRLFPGKHLFRRIASALSTETYIRVEEKSSEEDTKQIYLMHFSRFLNDNTTLSGSNLISQDVHILEGNPEFSLRLRFMQRRGLTQLSLQNERTYSRERSVRVRWHLIKEVGNQIDFVERLDNLSANQLSTRLRMIRSSALSYDLSYRPQQTIEFGFTIGVERATNFDSTQANLNDQALRLLYSFEGQGQARAELKREEVLFNSPQRLLPFELTGGRIVGKTWLWRIGFDYRITQFIQSTVQYDGRIENDSPPIHNARAEVRAFF